MKWRILLALAIAVSVSTTAWSQTVLWEWTSGGAIGAAGDVNADGVPDVVIGTYQYPPENSGRVVVLSGVDGSELATFYGEPQDQFGYSVGGVGDVDDDSYDDIIVGLPGRGGGECWVLSVATMSQIHRIFSYQDYDQIGSYVDGTLDHNDDGYRDVMVGRTDADETLIYDGLTGERINDVIAHVTSLATLDDITGDGIREILIGSLYSAQFDGGVVRLINGATLLQFGYWTGDIFGDQGFGCAVDGAGDVDGDGYADFLVGAEDSNRARLLSGSDGSVLYTFSGAGNQFGHSVAGVGDVNGDEVPDLLVGNSGTVQGKGGALLFSGHNGELLYEVPLSARSVVRLDRMNDDEFLDFLVGDDGHAHAYAGSKIFLNATQPNYSEGDSFSVSAQFGTPGLPAGILFSPVGVNMPLWLRIGAFDPVGRFTFGATVPPGLNGTTLAFKAFAIDEIGELIASGEEVVGFP